MKYTHLALVITSAMALAACGGSGSDHTTPQTNNNHGNNVNQNGNTQSDGMKITGYTLGSNSNFNSQPISGDDLDSIKIGGKTIVLIPKGISAGRFYQEKTAASYKVIGSNLKYARYGSLEMGRDDFYFISQGESSSTLPQKNRIEYRGNTVHTGEKLDDVVTGNAKFTVNFLDKSLTGVVSGNQFNDIELSATIHGNQFSGEKNGTKTTGGFYGNNAAELAGIYINTNKRFGGAFGAKKVTK